MDNIEKLLAKTKLELGVLYSAKNLLKILIAVLLIVFINYAFDFFALSSFTVRISLWLLALAFTIYLIIKTISAIVYLKTADEDIAVSIQKNSHNFKDDLINAVQLKKISDYGISRDLCEAFIEATSEKISQNPEKSGIGFKSLKNVFIIFAVLFLNFILFFNEFRLKRFLLPFTSRNYFTVMPKDTEASTGSDINIYALTKSADSTPYLFFREFNGVWRQKKMRKMDEKKYYEQIEKITESTEYFVKLLDDKSPVYKIKIVSPLAVSITEIEYIYPSYAGLADKTVQESEIEAPAGTTVKITARTNRNIKEAFLFTDTNEKIPATVTKNEIKTKFVIQNQSEYWIEPADAGGETVARPVKYKINIVKNNPPEIKIIAPAFNVMISENGNLRVVYSAEDDFGISEISINYLTLKKRQSIKSFTKPVQKTLDEHIISIAKLGLKPGDAVQYRLEAADNSAIGYSETYSFEVMSYETEHLLIENEISEFNMQLNEILSRQLQSKTALSKQDFETALKMQENTRKLMENANSNFKKTVAKMENDPFTNYRVYTEYNNLLETAQTLGNQKMRQAEESISGKKVDEAEQLQNRIIDELRKLGSFSENISKNRKMEDILSTAREMSESAESIEKNLQDMKALPDPEKLRELQKTADKLSELMGKLAEKLANMPRETPEDFAGNEKMKKLNLTEMKMLADEMKWTLESGNIDKAIELAEKLSRQILDILNSVESAANSSSSESYRQLQSQMNRSLNDLNKIIEDQQKILSDTQEMDKKRLEKVLALQKELLKKLSARQQQSIKELNNSRTILEKSTATPPGIFNLYAQPEAEMNIVLQELTSEKIDKTRELLPKIISELENMSKAIPAEEPQKYILLSKTIEQEILNELNNFAPPKTDVFSKEDIDKHGQLSQMQQSNRQKTQSLNQKLSKISEQTLSFPPDTIQKISSSEKNMGSAADELAQANTVPAIDSEKKALDDLLSGKESLENAAGQMDQMLTGAGSNPMGSGGQQIRMSGQGGAGGYTGFRTGFVKIPSADEYKPPKEFRESIIESLRQKYPAKYEPIIKEYFKRLIE